MKELSTEYHHVQSRRAEAGAAIRTTPAAGSEPPAYEDQHGILHSLSDAAQHTVEAVRAASKNVTAPGPPRDRDDFVTAAGADAGASYTVSRRSVTSAATSLLQPSSTALQLATAHPFSTATFGTLGAARLPSVLNWAADEAPDKLEGMLAERTA